ncbi:MAG: heavy-metal-associated domain-containing protein [Deltaproteobacteria bacterium]|nr:heavy-metal-associated domain-containing protein [Deltaproteobacteria bacterium]
MKTVKIKGMSCQHCVKAVLKALGEIDGVVRAQVDLDRGEATFEELHPVDDALIREKIAKAGYEVVQE